MSEASLRALVDEAKRLQPVGTQGEGSGPGGGWVNHEGCRGRGEQRRGHSSLHRL